MTVNQVIEKYAILTFLVDLQEVLGSHSLHEYQNGMANQT